MIAVDDCKKKFGQWERKRRGMDGELYAYKCPDSYLYCLQKDPQIHWFKSGENIPITIVPVAI